MKKIANEQLDRIFVIVGLGNLLLILVYIESDGPTDVFLGKKKKWLSVARPVLYSKSQYVRFPVNDPLTIYSGSSKVV